MCGGGAEAAAAAAPPLALNGVKARGCRSLSGCYSQTSRHGAAEAEA